MHRLRETSQNWSEKRAVVQLRVSTAGGRTNTCNNIVALAREVDICRRVLYNWRDRLDETDPSRARTPELIFRTHN